MKNYITLFIILLLGRNTAVAQESKEAVLHRLNQSIEQSATYIQAKEQRITSLKKALKKPLNQQKNTTCTNNCIPNTENLKQTRQ